jgi:hypothetical protein
MKWFAILKLLLCLRWKNWKPCLSWSKNFEYAYVRPETIFLSMFMLDWKIFLTSPRRQHVREKFVRLGQNPRKCWSKHDEPPPNVDGYATSLHTRFMNMNNRTLTDLWSSVKSTDQVWSYFIIRHKRCWTKITQLDNKFVGAYLENTDGDC